MKKSVKILIITIFGLALCLFAGYYVYDNFINVYSFKEISNVAKFQGMEVKHFAVGYDVMRKKDFVMCNLDDKFINKFYVGI